MKLAVQRSTTKVFSFVGALAVVGALLFAASAVAAPKEGPPGPPGPTGATGATGPAGANGTNGVTGAKGATGTNGANGSNGGLSPACPWGTAPPSCTLPSKAQESGVWSAPPITGVTGDPQVQSMGVASFPVRLKETAEIASKYRDEPEAETPESPCVGSVNEPVAEPGWLCTYRGGGGFGSLESQDKNAKFFNFEKPNGVYLIPPGIREVGVLGALIVFRSNQFTEEGTTPAELTERTYLVAGGSWSVTEK